MCAKRGTSSLPAACTAAVPDYIGFTIPQLLDQYLAPLGIPAFQGANIGHVSNQLSLPVGIDVEMDGPQHPQQRRSDFEHACLGRAS